MLSLSQQFFDLTLVDHGNTNNHTSTIIVGSGYTCYHYSSSFFSLISVDPRHTNHLGKSITNLKSLFDKLLKCCETLDKIFIVMCVFLNYLDICNLVWIVVCFGLWTCGLLSWGLFCE